MNALFQRLEAAQLPPSDRPRIALLTAGGDVWEDFLGTIGVSLERFCAEGPGGWMLGYMDALYRAGVRTVLIFFSAQVLHPIRYIHPPTGNCIVVLPVPVPYRIVRRRLRSYRTASFGQYAIPRPEGWRQQLVALLQNLGPHMSTPLVALGRELRQARCAAILCQEYEYFRFETSVALGRVLGLPVWATFQGSDAEHNPLSRRLKPYTLARAGGLLIAAGTEIERVRRRYGAAAPTLLQVFNPVDSEAWHPGGRAEARAALGLSPTTRLVVWHGRIVIYNKGLDLMLAAWEQVCRERPGQDLRLMLMGSGPDAEEFAQRLKAYASLPISWLNEYLVDRAAIRRFLVAGDVFAFPSRLEGFAVAPLEAMACGLPVVAAAASGIPDIFQGGEADGGVVVPLEAEAAFATALGGLLDAADRRRKLGLQARQRVEAVLSLEAVGQQLRAALLGKTNALD